ncbi:UPF0488 protein C8orf33 homolog [Colius striatus]|uniref:UPF0488 protein C8orf33 homolog n=1 Tax=Colius striatus TaxID=57412 RepID=UPI002B1E028F|nr:UPF0488 protein C8orf33 homolog [Colius striatus]
MSHVVSHLSMAEDQQSVDKAVPEMGPEASGRALNTAPGVSTEQAPTSVRATQQHCNGALGFAASAQEPKFASSSGILAEAHPLVHSVAAGDEVLGGSVPAESAGMPRVSALQKPELTQTAGSVAKEDRTQPEAAPGDETVTEKATAGGDAHKRKKKKKKNQRAAVSEAELQGGSGKTQGEANTRQSKDTSQQDESSQHSGDQLQKEVDWCVEQLELGLKTQKPTPRQAEEALRAIRTLRNAKAPLVKKRQLMRTMFGDYRKKMEEELAKELKQVEAALKSARIVEVQSSTRSTSGRFIRKSLAACRRSQAAAGRPAEPPRTLLTASQEELKLNLSEESLGGENCA